MTINEYLVGASVGAWQDGRVDDARRHYSDLWARVGWSMAEALLPPLLVSAVTGAASSATPPG